MKNKCVDCNKEISKNAKRCISCAVKYSYTSGKRKILTVEEKQQISKILSGKKKGKNNPAYGKSPLKETRNKISYKLKLAYKEGRKINWNFGKHMPLKVKIKSSCSQRKIDISNWNGFGKDERYPWKFYKIREKIIYRDNYICQICNKKITGKYLHIHHIDYNKQNNTMDNLICLCNKCHGKTNYDRKYWIKYFKNIF